MKKYGINFLPVDKEKCVCLNVCLSVMRISSSYIYMYAYAYIVFFTYV